MSPGQAGIRSALLPVDLTARREAIRDTRHPLALLADGLALELEPLLHRQPPIPAQKARLTRVGGRCPVHGGLLAFDPWSPHRHRCGRCGIDYTGREHDDWWAMGAQLWTVERAVHAATLFGLRGDVAHAGLASRILAMLAESYASWPNLDNVLGPSRPFFSTYLESIWLLNACHALALLEAAEAAGAHALGEAVRDRLIEPSAALIAGFAEGTSNRQVWNEVAVLSALRLLGDHTAIDRRLDAHGLPWLVQNAVLDDGSWYEGENYHLFAHRGLWYGVQLLRTLGRPLDDNLTARYRAGFVTPFVGVLPDDTFPSRRDSQYSVSIRQWRIAEWCELGYAETGDARIAGVLTRLYDGTVPRTDTGRWRSTADAERNTPASALSRADGSWRSLLMANVDASAESEWSVASGCLPAQGLAVLRREGGRTYVALEGGHTGGGHGHPDRLALTLQTGVARWLEDPGTGSYVDRSLHWYRSTLAHAAPLVDGHSQCPVNGQLLAFDDQGEVGWIWKRAADIAPGVTIDRTIVLANGYLVDLVEWRTDHSTNDEPEISLPIAGNADVDPAPAWSAAAAATALGLEDGFDFLEQREEAPLPPCVKLRAKPSFAATDHTEAGAFCASAWYFASAPGMLARARAPGAPEHGMTWRHWLRVRGRAGCIAGVWSWTTDDTGAGAASRRGAARLPVHTALFTLEPGPVIIVMANDLTRDEHSRSPDGWKIERQLLGSSRRLSLGGLVAADSPAPARGQVDHGPRLTLRVRRVSASAIASAPGDAIKGAPRTLLAEQHYVPTEQGWIDAGQPSALIQLATTPSEFIVDADVRTGPVVSEPMRAENALDNERADVNADGLQCYFARPGAQEWAKAVLVVPVTGAEARLTPIAGLEAPAPRVSWRPTASGWAMRLVWRRQDLPLDDAGRVHFDLIVNERPAERQRRRGQLVLSGGGGFGYLRGDRQDPAKAVRLSLQ